MTGKDTAGGGLRERKKRATRAALAEAAVRLAAEHGADHVTVEAISAAAGVSVRTFFNYFDSRDDAFVVIDADAGVRVRRALLEAPAELSPLAALREALAAELSEVERQHELWSLHAQVLRAAPHLFVRSLGAHMADEAGLAEIIARRIASGPGADAARASEEPPEPGLYPRLLAAVAVAAVRVSIQHWSDRQDELAFADVFREAFTLLAAGLPAPTR